MRSARVSAIFFSILFSLASMTLVSCLTLSESVDALTTRAVAEGLISRYQAALLNSAARAANKASRELTPEEEYYVGRAVAAQVFSLYRPYNNSAVNEYLNLLGQGLAVYSSRPEIFAGYRFFALDSDEVNAVATPGGHILITRGLLRVANDEDELAAVLAHEIAHVSLRHGMSSVQGSRLLKIASDLARDSGMSSGGVAADFTASFGGSIAELASGLITTGYSQTFELKADAEARAILGAARYDRAALTRLISRLPARDPTAGSGFALTHPDPSYRLAAIASSGKPRLHPAEGWRGEAVESARAERFSAMRSLF